MNNVEQQEMDTDRLSENSVDGSSLKAPKLKSRPLKETLLFLNPNIQKQGSFTTG